VDSYQKHLFKLFEDFREAPTWPNYPPYKQGEYFEEYFLRRYREDDLKTKRYFLPIAWSSCYINHRDAPLPRLQQTLNSLKQDEEYFMVGVHDDSPREILPPKTIKFLAGGNKGDDATIPIPVVVNKIPEPYLENLSYEKTHLASFVGSLTHPIRANMCRQHRNNADFLLQVKQWSPTVPENQLQNFLSISAQSHFVLCPRGYAPTSCRLYETMQLRAVPVYISDKFWLPWAEELDWKSICVFIKEEEISYMDLILKDCLYSDEYKRKKQKIKEIYDKYFTFDVILSKIVERASQ